MSHAFSVAENLPVSVTSLKLVAVEECVMIATMVMMTGLFASTAILFTRKLSAMKLLPDVLVTCCSLRSL